MFWDLKEHEKYFYSHIHTLTLILVHMQVGKRETSINKRRKRFFGMLFHVGKYLNTGKVIEGISRDSPASVWIDRDQDLRVASGWNRYFLHFKWSTVPEKRCCFMLKLIEV